MSAEKREARSSSDRTARASSACGYLLRRRRTRRREGERCPCLAEPAARAFPLPGRWHQRPVEQKGRREVGTNTTRPVGAHTALRRQEDTAVKRQRYQEPMKLLGREWAETQNRGLR
ncbi:hypothetical protein SKAU_G00186280 [Synaphobranchus kaupii]|uniref:Uncharacterized protein n=1 Tax=Synaphobranchus kaupii TaxID=118154 RepID=A0A9Q1FCS8_SYNKA|nr:hypothetical protein SKAU_G00186280 [Synaphobranchus kaupii]